MALYGVGLDTTVQKLNFEFRLALKKKGGIGIRSLATIFKKFDLSGNKKLDYKEFEAALGQIGIFPTKVELQALMAYYDLDKDGNITYEEFLKGIREPLTSRRKAIIEKVFAILDRSGTGEITVENICKIYKVEKHKDFISGKKTKEEILGEFLNNFEGPRGNKDGIVTKTEFLDYYADISMTISSDEYFIGLIESAWMITEKDSVTPPKEQAFTLVKNAVEKLKMAAAPLDGKMMQKAFKEFNKSKCGGITIDELYAMFIKLGISVERKFITEVLKIFDKNQSGAVEFDEFQEIIKAFM